MSPIWSRSLNSTLGSVFKRFCLQTNTGVHHPQSLPLVVEMAVSLEVVPVVVESGIEIGELHVEGELFGRVVVLQSPRVIQRVGFIPFRDWALHEVHIPVGRVMQEGKAELVFLAIKQPVPKQPVEVGIVARVKCEVPFLRVVGDSRDFPGLGNAISRGRNLPAQVE